MESELENALIAWLNTFDISEGHKISTFEDLYDGTALTEIMNKISPKFFDNKSIVKDCGDNWSLVHKNLSYFYDGLSKYYLGVLYRPFEKNSVDILAISKEKDFVQLWNLVELMIGAIIHCDQKEVFINAILYLEEQYQTQLMHIINKILERTKLKENPEIHDVEKEKKLLIKLDEVENENAILITRLQESNEEKEKLRIKVNDLGQQCFMLEEQIKNFNLKQEQFLTNAGIKDPEDYENIINIKDEKLRDLELFIKDLKQKHEDETSSLKEDIEIKRKKILNNQKIENSLEYYKQKYEESLRISERKVELEKLNELYINKLEDFEKKINFLNAKISKYKEKISVEKNKAINHEIDLSKKIIEIESLRQEKTENEQKISKLEGEINDKSQLIQKMSLENHLKDLHKGESTPSLGNELNELIMNMEAQHTLMKIERRGSLKLQSPLKKGDFNVISEKNETNKQIEGLNKELNEEQIELLEKENGLLIEKLKELQKENERMRIDHQKSMNEKQNQLNISSKEIDKMKEEIGKLKIITPNLANKELIAENKMIKEEYEMYKANAQNSNNAELQISTKHQNDLSEKNSIIEALSKELDVLKKEDQALQTEYIKFKEEFNKESFIKQSNELQELQKEVKILRSLNNEEIEHKNDELNLLVAILYDLRMKYQELEKGKISSKTAKSSDNSSAPKVFIRDHTPNLRKK